MTEGPGVTDAAGPGGGDRAGGVGRQDFAAFYASSYRAVLAATLAVGGSLPEAEDAVQEAMKDALRAWDRVASPYPYVRTAAVRRLLRTRRREVAGRAVAVLAAPGGADPHAAGLTLWEDGEWVTQFLQSLPAAQREVIALLVDEFSAGEIAALLGKSEEAVRQNLCATRRRLGARPGRRPDPSLLDLDPAQPEVAP